MDKKTPATKRCHSCHRDLPLGEFGKDASEKSGLRYICRECVRKRSHERLTAELERKVRLLYGGRCAICDTVEDLKVIPTVELKRRVPRSYVLLCPKCRSMGVPTTSRYIRDCMRCGHRWVARKPETITCPKCKSPYWYRPKRV